MRRIRSVLVPALVAMLAASALGGCAKHYWSKPGSTAEQFNRDSQECAKEAKASPAAAPSVLQGVYRTCLTARGYLRENLLFPTAGAHRGIEDF